jgi:HEAT repeat protein
MFLLATLVCFASSPGVMLSPPAANAMDGNPGLKAWAKEKQFRTLGLLFRSPGLIGLGFQGGESMPPSPPKDPDEQFLQESKVPTDGPGLLNYLKARSAHDGDLLQLDRLIRQLGAEDFRLRQEAAQKLIKLGPPAHALLLQAQKDKDKERARRAKECAQEINRAWNFGLNLTVVRRLVKLHPEGTAQALLQFLPYAADEECEEEIWFGLDTLAVGQAFQPDTNHRQAGKPDLHGAPVLGTFAEFLKDKFPIRRAAAGYLFTRRGNADQRPAGKKLLADPDPIVRLRTAQGLLASKDKDAIPVLIGLLEKLRWTEDAWQAEEMLHWVAGDDSPEATIGAGSTKARQKCRKAWEEWWEVNGSKLDLAKLDEDYRRPGLILLHTSSGLRKNPHYISLVGCDGRPRWELDLFAADVKLLPKDRILVSEWEEREIPRVKGATRTQTSGLSERDFNGKILWRAPSQYAPNLAYRLVNQEIVMLDRYQVTQTSPHGTEIYSRRFQITEGRFKDSPLQSLHRLTNGRILCGYEYGESLELWEGDITTGAIAKKAVVQRDKFTYPYTIEEVPAGGFLITTPNLGQVEQLDAHGKRVWQSHRFTPLHAVPLRNRNTLILSGSRLIEVTRDGRTLSECFIKGSATRFSRVLGLVVLGFDHASPADLNLEWSIPHRIKGLKSKDPFVRSASAYLLGQLGPKAAPAVSQLIEATNDSDPNVRGAASAALKTLGSAALPVLLIATKDPRINVRCAAIRALGQYRTRANKVIPILLYATNADEEAVRQEAVRALGDLGSDVPEAIEALTQILTNNKEDVRFRAAERLGLMGPKAKTALPSLFRCMKDKDLQVAGEAAWALGKIGKHDKELIPPLMKMLKGENQRDWFLAAVALGQIGPEAKVAIPDLLNLLKVKIITDDKLAEKIKLAATWALGEFGPDAAEAVPEIIKVFQNKKFDSTTRMIAASTLGRIGPKAKAAIPILRQALKDEDEDKNLKTFIRIDLSKIEQ